MSATRRKGSRGGRAASRAGGPPASNALTWAESLAAGEAAPGASALEWAESLAESEPAPSPWGSAAGAGAPVGSDPVDETTGSPWGHVPAPVIADGESDGDANPWGSVAAAEPAVTRGRGKNAGGKSAGSKSGKAAKSRSKGKGAKSGTKGAPKSESAPTPAGGFPLGQVQVAEDDDYQVEALPDEVGSVHRPDVPEPDDVPPAGTSEPEPHKAESRKAESRKAESRKAGKQRPKGRLSAPDTAQQKRIRRTLSRGLPKLLDKTLVLVLAGVTAAALGLGTGWGMTQLQGDEKVLSTADAASCAQTQMAWTQAANAQSAMVEDQPDTLRKGFINARNALQGVTPPEAIAGDWAIAFTYYSTVANNIEKVKATDGPAVSDAVGGAQQELDTEAMVEASQRVQEFVASNCRG